MLIITKICGFLALFLMLNYNHLVTGSFDLVDSCRIFCEGPILDAVQKAHLFKDSKDFVDMPLRYSPDATLRAFELIQNKSDPDKLRDFISAFFLPPGHELQQCHPPDWDPRPQTFDQIQDPLYRQWAYEIHFKWRSLCRKIKDDVMQHPDHYSLIPLPHPFIAPGGRFREVYYWDTYWIIRGLIRSEMYETAKNMIKNLAEMIKRFGFVPNGGRIYYLRRTQPPLFAGSVYEYYKETGDVRFLEEMLPYLESEFKYFDQNRKIDWKNEKGEQFHFYQYRVKQEAPRPESYKEDLATASHCNTDTEKVQIYSDIAAACESGWDFSSRWFKKDGEHKHTMKGIRTSRIVPVDLNAFMCWNSRLLSKLHAITGNQTASTLYENKYNYLTEAIEQNFWNEDDGAWYDLDLETGRQSRHYYASNLTPLFAKCTRNTNYYYKRVVEYLQNSRASAYLGGLPTSFTWINEQWDNPNGWAPTNHVVIEGLRYSDDPRVQEVAFQLADKWIQTNYIAYIRSGGKMFEKYNIEESKSHAGGGGEYEVQEGFGWTNGVVLDLLVTYGHRLKSPQSPHLIIERDYLKSE